MQKSETPLDIPGRLRQVFPILFELVDEDDIDWKAVHRVFRRQHEKHIERKAREKREINVQNCFYYLISRALKGEPHAVRMLDFIRKLLEELVDRLSLQEKMLIITNVNGMLVNIDLKFLNFVGELLVLVQIKKTGHYQLLQCEYVPDISRRSSIDFRFLRYADRKEILVEVVNIHLDKKNTDNDEAIARMTEQKIRGKLLDKGIQEWSNIFLVVVLWGDYSELTKVRNFLRQNPLVYKQALPPVCFATFIDPAGQVVHRFGTLETVLDINVVR